MRLRTHKAILCRAILPAWGAGPYLPALVLERPIFVREMSDGLYTAFTYLTYKVIACKGLPPPSCAFRMLIQAVQLVETLHQADIFD